MSRDKYIIVFHDITQANPDWGNLYKAYLPAESLLSAELLEKSVKGMLPKNKLGSALFRNLSVFVGASHSHEAQKPQTINLNDIN